MRSFTLLVFELCVASPWFGGAAPAFGSTVTLSDQNSTVTIDPYSSAGVENWTVDGSSNQLNQQWFWYRIGSTGLQQSIDTLGTTGTTTVDQTEPSEVIVTYAGTNGLTISVKYDLTGDDPGSGASDLAETIKIKNTTRAPISVHFFQYSNFTLDNGIPGDSVQFTDPNDVQQSNSSATLAETVIAPTPSYREDGYWPAVLNNITATPDYQLTQVNSGSDAGVGTGGPNGPPGDVSWAYEWDPTIQPGATYTISKDKELSGVVSATVPEPSALALAAASLMGLAGLCIRRAAARVVRAHRRTLRIACPDPLSLAPPPVNSLAPPPVNY